MAQHPPAPQTKEWHAVLGKRNNADYVFSKN